MARTHNPTPSRSGTGDHLQTAPRRVLVVDDNREIRELLASFISSRAFEVGEARNGVEALHLFEEAPFDLVITDVRMPLMDGITLLRRLKSIDGNVPVVLITGNAAATISRNDGAADAETILFKPFRFEAIDAILDQVFKLSQTDGCHEEDHHSR